MEQLQFEARHLVPRAARHGNAFEETIERLLTSIKLGIFAVGQKLPPERELAEMLGVSRATLRDALAELQKANYIEVKRGRYGGTVVASNAPAAQGPNTKPDPAELEDVLTFRQVVEPAAAALAAEASLSPAARNHLLTALAEVSAAPAEHFRPKDARFHIAIAELTGSPSLVAAVADVRARVSNLLDLIPLLPPNLEHSNEQHKEIADAILRGDSEAARRAASHHIEGTANLLRGFLA
ncbi:FadR/GntR family transcriptional regulator [Arthrobacter mobilis]|uniref:FadR family transcriptional regulator n=1 Tax=Arthrobacter mobilis TaxID=2724944 RepID=A0A7X6HAK6_9MICC|nr:FCD domain-containing protein [Arthrobacter mobilis]NKX53085.1 FadR family transcriptional regulator [Arthrobacter mobilis]